VSLIVWFLPFYPPTHNAGTEWNAHALNRYLIERKGHRVVICSGTPGRAPFEGVEFADLFGFERHTLVRSAALFFTAHYPDYSELALRYSRSTGVPLVHIVDTLKYRDRFVALEGVPNQYLIYNSEWTRDHIALDLPFELVRTPVDWRDHAVQTTRRCVTLANVSQFKGGSLLVELARRMPHKQFLGVLGASGDAVIERGLPNLTYLPQRPGLREVFAETGILLMPTIRESWGRSAVEAMASGIPVIAHYSPGVAEALSYAGLFCDRENPDEWVRTIEALDEPAFYAEISSRCTHRARALDPAPDLERFGTFVDRILAA
jgi:glycosyltransferase involved in cell wall biosynthesis